MTGTLVRVHVLLVEDELTLADSVRRGLEAEGMSVDHAADGLDGLWREREGVFDAIVLTDQAVKVWVDDDGPGVPHADRERVFQRFVRLDDARTRDAGGAGLGLAVVRATVVSMGGTIEILDSPSGGARFELSFPSNGFGER